MLLYIKMPLYSTVSSEATLEIRTPKLRKLKLGCGWNGAGAAVITAPSLSALEIDCSAKVTVLAPWEQLDRLIITAYQGNHFVWGSEGSLHMALRSCSNLKSLSIQSQRIKNVSYLTEGLGSALTELIIPDTLLSEILESKSEHLIRLRKLTVSFGSDDDTYESARIDESRLFKGLRNIECFPKLEFLRLEEIGYVFTLRAAQALLSLQKKLPRLEIVFLNPW